MTESLPLHEDIKPGTSGLDGIFANYRQSMRNLAAAGIRIICYNFMPVFDWTRISLAVALPGGGTVLKFNMHEYTAFDRHMLKRPGAETGHDEARSWKCSMAMPAGPRHPCRRIFGCCSRQ